MRRDPARHAHHRSTAIALLACIALVFGTTGCTKKEQDPEDARRERVEARLRDSFSAREAGCIVEQLDATVIRALDRKADLPADSTSLAQYSEALQVCVTGGGTTTTTPSTTTSGD